MICFLLTSLFLFPKVLGPWKPYSVTIAKALPNYLCNYEFCINNFILFKRKGVGKRGRKKKDLKFDVFGPGTGVWVSVGTGCVWKGEAIQSVVATVEATKASASDLYQIILFCWHRGVLLKRCLCTIQKRMQFLLLGALILSKRVRTSFLLIFFWCTKNPVA